MTFRRLSVQDADCFGDDMRALIRERIVSGFNSLTIFEKTLRLRGLLNPTSYEAHIEQLLPHTNEEWRFESLNEFLTSRGSARASRLALITGGPGKGKSPIAAALCRAKGVVIHAHHFANALGDPRSAELPMVMRTLAYQLGLMMTLDDLADSIDALPDELLAGALSDDATAAWEVLCAQLRAFVAAGKRPILLFDAIDEAPAAPEGAPSTNAVSEDVAPRSILELVCALGRLDAGAAGLSVIVTTRPEQVVLAPLWNVWSAGSSCLQSFAPEELRTTFTAQVRGIIQCGVSLAFLLRFTEEHVAPLGLNAATWEVVNHVIKPATVPPGSATGASRYAERLLRSEVGPPEVFVSHAFGNPFALVTEALRAHFSGRDPTQVFVWLDIFAVNQHEPGSELHGGDVLPFTLEKTRETCVILDRLGSVVLSRLWCLYEIGCTSPDRLVLLPPRDADLTNAAATVNARSATCSKPKDTPRMKLRIEQSHRSLEAFSDMLRLRLFSMLPSGDLAATHLLAALLAASARPTARALDAMGLYRARRQLPGWGRLFVERDGFVLVTHKRLEEWLSDAARVMLLDTGRALWAEHERRRLREDELMDFQRRPDQP